MLDASLDGRCNGALVLGEALAGSVQRIGADDQQPVDADECLFQACRVIEIGLAGDDALLFEFGEFFRAARRGDNVAGSDLVGLDEVMDDTLAELPGSAGDQDDFAHTSFPSVLCWLCCASGLKKRVTLE